MHAYTHIYAYTCHGHLHKLVTAVTVMFRGKGAQHRTRSCRSRIHTYAHIHMVTRACACVWERGSTQVCMCMLCVLVRSCVFSLRHYQGAQFYHKKMCRVVLFKSAHTTNSLCIDLNDTAFLANPRKISGPTGQKIVDHATQQDQAKSCLFTSILVFISDRVCVLRSR